MACVDGPVVFTYEVWLVIIDVVDMLLEVLGLLELVMGADDLVVAGTVDLPVDGGVVLEVADVVLLEGTVRLVVADVAGILHSVAGPTPVLGCFVEPGGMTNT